MSSPSSYGRSLEATPTWAVAVVCFVLVAISLVLEEVLHRVGHWLQHKRKPSLVEALEKIKAELMILGFISLLLVVTQQYLTEICIPTSIGHSWHPCDDYETGSSSYPDPCVRRGMVQFVSAYGIHQLHIFIFTLAIAHILYCIVTLGLGRLKMRKWRFWEDETKTTQYQYYNDPERFRFARDTSFGRRHLHFWSKSPILLWIVCFFRQFFTSVQKVDYLTLRHGFIAAHLAPQSQENFNFHKYINRSLEEDFKVVVGITPTIWFCAILILLTNTNGWYSHFWLPFIPLVILLVIGAKLQVIITKMGSRILERGDIVKGTITVQPGDDLFWFNRPGLVLFLIHLVLFLNAFQLAFFAWSWYEFGYPSCYHETLDDIIIRIAMGIITQFLCSYVTLPLYALVTQMGTKMKPVIFSDQVASALRGWHQTAKKHIKHGHKSGSTTPFSSRPGTPLHGGSLSPVYLLRGHQNYHDSVEHGMRPLSPRGSNFSNEGWGGAEGAPLSPHQHEIEIEDFTRSSTPNPSEIERDLEDPQPISEAPHNVRGSINDFSFREKYSK